MAVFEYEGTEYEFPDDMQDTTALRLIREDRGEAMPAATPQRPAGMERLPADLSALTKEQRLRVAQEKYNRGQVKQEPVGAALAPRTTSLPPGARGPRAALAGALDAASFAGRAVASTPALKPGGETYGEALGRTGGKPGTGLAGLGGDIVRDPALPLSMGTGGAVAAGGKALLGAGAKSLLGRAAVGAAQSVLPAAVHQAENVAAGGEVKPWQAALEVGMGGAVPLVLGGAVEGAKRLSKGAYGLIKRMASGLSGVSEDALETASTKGGRAALKGAAGTEAKIAEELLDAIDNIDDYMPEAKVVNKAVSELPPVQTAGVKASLEKSLVKNAGTPSAKAANKKIGELIAYLDENPQMAAADFRGLRMQFDAEAAAAFNKDYKTYVEKALVNAREQMARDLIATAEKSGKPEYADAMKTWAEKIKAVDRVKAVLGSSSEMRNRRVEQFVDHLHGKNKSYTQKIVKDLEDIFGGDIVESSKLAQQASEFGPSGTPGWLPTQTTGRSALAPIVGIAVGGPAAVATGGLASPKVATGLTLPAVRTASAVADRAASVRLPPKLHGPVATAITNLVHKPQDKRKRDALQDVAALRAKR